MSLVYLVGSERDDSTASFSRVVLEVPRRSFLTFHMGLLVFCSLNERLDGFERKWRCIMRTVCLDLHGGVDSSLHGTGSLTAIFC